MTGTPSGQVFFSAQLSRDVQVSLDQTLVLDRVLSNAGGGYDAATGVFTAPRPATYLFLATGRVDWDRRGLGACERRAGFKVVAEGRDVAPCFSLGPTSCSAHAVLRLGAGHQVRLASNFHASSFRGHGYTSFCGLLIHPEL